MKKYQRWMVVPIGLATVLAGALSAYSQTVQVSPGFNPDPQVISGTSGGANNSDCGYIPGAPSQVIKVTAAFPYLRFSVQGGGQPTLLIDGPTGRFCALADRYSGSEPQISGFWSPGTYSVYVGDRAQGNHPYQLSISQQRK